MSVWVTALLGHEWDTFSAKRVGKIVEAGFGVGQTIEWELYPTYRSPEEEYATDGIVSCRVSEGPSMRFGTHMLAVNQSKPWSAFLIHQEIRNEVLTPLVRLSKFVESEVLIVPEGSLVVDEMYGGSTFNNAKAVALAAWGPPDLAIDKMYTDSDIAHMSRTRVHYFLLNQKS
jgi:hypothetical protein